MDKTTTDSIRFLGCYWTCQKVLSKRGDSWWSNNIYYGKQGLEDTLDTAVNKTWVWRREPGARTQPSWREKQIKIEKVALSARLTREDKVMLSLKKSWSLASLIYLNDLLLVETFVLPAMIPVSLKNPEFFWGKLEGMIGVQVISYCCYQTLPLSVVLGIKWSSDHSIAELKVNKIKL